jgi:hypothetical protein
MPEYLIIRRGESREFWIYDKESGETEILRHCQEDNPTCSQRKYGSLEKARIALKSILKNGWDALEYDPSGVFEDLCHQEYMMLGEE